ncbi:hypothetical protein BDQ12DRAFT_737515 [Crucibulum laeve]|uniref:G domain-containing protein n=1 Tax=Crucibulum laeve TaxID=68775 RepID=A0A5C3LU70_9AGAR|nr:hypothetical protein BDQ12DRAFT_737515 [Crucibulum laeve]
MPKISDFSGVGKSSLVNHAFNVDTAIVAHQEHGICDINTEIISQQNPRFVLHDSQGFEPGEVTNLEKVKNFIQSRGMNTALKDRVHAVWLCIEVPFAGGRVFETGDEEFLKFAALNRDLPIVVVFTKFDQLVSRMEENMSEEEMDMSEEDINKLSLSRAEIEFTDLCIRPLEHVDHMLPYAKVSVEPQYQLTLANLIDLTQGLVENHVEGDVWIVSAMAQRASAQAKINSSIEVGMKKYWQGLASSANFGGSTLAQCLATIHVDITSSWNFNDPDNLLNGENFQCDIKRLAQLVAPDPAECLSWFESLGNIQTLIGVGTVFTSAVAPALAAIGLSAVFIKWIAVIYQQTPEVLRCLMGYIVDLTLIMDQLFLDTLPIKPPRRLTEEQVEMALENYTASDAALVHREIREYANKTTFSRILRSNNAQEKVRELIGKYNTVDASAELPRT